MSKVKQEQIGGTPISKVIDNNVSFKTKTMSTDIIKVSSESEEPILFPEFEIAQLNSNNNEERTVKGNEFHIGLSDEDYVNMYELYHLSYEIKDLREDLSAWHLTRGKFDFIFVQDFLTKLNMSEKDANVIMQRYGLRDPQNNWADHVVKHGLVVLHRQYRSGDNKQGIARWHDHDILTPIGHQFFDQIFAIPRHWQFNESSGD